jgi:hypothetical protein
MLPSMTKGEIVGHIFIDVNSRCHYDVMICCYDEFSLISIVYQSGVNVKKYAEIEIVSSRGGANNMQKLILGRENAIHNKFMIIVDHDRNKNVPMIKA